MGAYVSTDDCKSHYNITINCTFAPEANNIGGYGRGKIPSDSDIAGIGVVSSFLATTSFALILSIISVLWLIVKRARGDPHGEKARKKAKRRCQIGLSELCEELVISASDTQVFTGGAYAITLRYFKGCSITAYHYDIVANLMLLTCATHLMSITIVRNYWRYPWLGIVRTLICTGVFIVTGILLANQNSASEKRFPSETPMANETDSTILLPAACFQKGNSQLLPTLVSSLGAKAKDAFFSNKPGNKIPGWSNYLIILLLYLVAGFVDILRWFRRGAQSFPNGRRARVLAFLHCSSAQRQSRQQKQNQDKKPFFSVGNMVFTLFTIYLLAGVGVSSWTVVTSAQYIWSLRSWAKSSGWLLLEDGGQSAEDDATSFGQLVPIFLNLLIIFVVAQVLSRASSRHTERKYDIYGGVIHDTSPSSPPPPSNGGGGGKGGSNMDLEDLNIGGHLIPGGAKSNVAVHVHQYYSGVPSSDVTTPMSNLPPASQASSPRPAGNTNSSRWDSITTVSNPSTPGLMPTMTGTPPPQSSGTTSTPESHGQFYSSPPQQQPPTSASATPLLGGYYQVERQANSVPSSQTNPSVQPQAQAPAAPSYSAPSEYFQGTAYQQYLLQQQQQQPQAQQQQYQAQKQEHEHEQQHQQYQQQYQLYEIQSSPPPATQAQQTQPQAQR